MQFDVSFTGERNVFIKSIGFLGYLVFPLGKGQFIFLICYGRYRGDLVIDGARRNEQLLLVACVTLECRFAVP